MEHDEQAALFQCAARHESQVPELRLLFAIPNAGKRSRYERGQLLDEGLKAGVPDLCLPVPHWRLGGWYHGLYIEMKYGKNKPTDKQEWWLAELDKQGYLVLVCHSWVEAWNRIVSYLGRPEFML